ncbi:MAG: hypothetical protein M3Y50_14860 [Acidobacteriota bacterium]|nr:hypothetical protein [Acidobacteriota bacterium]
MRPTVPSRCSVILLFHLITAGAIAQTGGPPPNAPEAVPPLLQFRPSVPEPTMPAARRFQDSRFGISFTVPAAWNLTRRDFEVSTFHLDARSAAHNALLRAVASISFNPHPTSTFSGALFYFSVAPQTTSTQCAFQATPTPSRTATAVEIGGLTFTRGYDEHGGVCTESRDEIFTTWRKQGCFRFDVVINNFCGGDVSGIRDINQGELASVRKRMQAILDTVHFDAK